MANKIYHTLSIYDRNYILENYKDKSCDEIANFIGCNTNTVRAFLKKQGLNNSRHKKWTEQKNLELIELVKQGYSAKTLASKYGVSLMVIYNRIGQLKKDGYDAIQFSERPKDRLSDEDKQYIQENTNKKSIKEMAEWIGCTKTTVREYQKCINLYSESFSHWSPEKKNTMLELLSKGVKTIEVAQILGVTARELRQKLWLLRKRNPSIPSIPVMRMRARKNNANK